MTQLLPRRGRLVGLFFHGEEPDGPPFPITPAHSDELFRQAFRLTHDEPVADSLPLFAGRERWQEWTRL